MLAKVDRCNVSGQSVRVLTNNRPKQPLGNRDDNGGEEESSNAAQNPRQKGDRSAEALQLARRLRRKEGQSFRAQSKVPKDRIRNCGVSQNSARNFLGPMLGFLIRISHFQQVGQAPLQIRAPQPKKAQDNLCRSRNNQAGDEHRHDKSNYGINVLKHGGPSPTANIEELLWVKK